MLKLMKYEFIHSIRTFFLSYVVFLVMCMIYPILASHLFYSNVLFLFMFFNFGFILLVMGIMIALFVSLFINFYRSMFKRPAYLSLTLPVTSMQLILSKVIMSMIWLVIGIGVMFVGMFLMLMITGLINDSMTLLDVFHAMGEWIGIIRDYVIFDMQNFIKDVLTVFSGLIFTIGSIYFSLTAAHTKWLRKHRLIFGITLYIVVNVVLGYIGASLFNYMDIYDKTVIIFQSFYYMSLGLCMVFGTIYIFDHYVEIE